MTEDEIRRVYEEKYRDEYFVACSRKGGGGCEICAVLQFLRRIAACRFPNGTLVAVSALDNMDKGAAGQAVQNMNLALAGTKPWACG